MTNTELKYILRQFFKYLEYEYDAVYSELTKARLADDEVLDNFIAKYHPEIITYEYPEYKKRRW